MKKKLLGLLLTVVVSVAMVGCGKEAEEETVPAVTEEFETEEEVVEEPVEEVVEEPEVIPEGMYRSELTNEWIDEELQNQRPVAVMIDNELTALPHFGLNDADVVYEMMNSTANDFVTRFMAVVKDYESVDQLGSIRSVRPTNLIIAPEWNAIVCHDGGPFYINAYLENPYVDHISGYFSRVDNGKPREFTEYMLPGDMEDNFARFTNIDKEYNEYYTGEPHFKFASESKPVDMSDCYDIMDCTLVDLPFEHNGSQLDYDEETGRYLYSEYGEPHLDGKTGEQLTFKNVILQQMDYEQYDEHGYMLWHAIGAGYSGYYITEGKAIPITWSKVQDTERTIYYNCYGEEITLNTGNTYIGFVATDVWSQLVVK